MKPVLQARIHHKKGSSKAKNIRVLFYSDASNYVIHQSIIKRLKQTKSKESKWSTLVRTLHTTHKCKIEINFPQLSPTCNTHWDIHVTTDKSQ